MSGNAGAAVSFTDSFNRSNEGDTSVDYNWGYETADRRVLPSQSRHLTSVTITCRTCGHAVTVGRWDGPIASGDPRLCEHLGGPTS